MPNQLIPPPRVTVVIPSYNHAHFVEGAIESVLGQTFRSLEIIVIDDGSTDDTKSFVSRFDGRVQYIFQENQGLSTARNKGIMVARGEFIGLLDADDFYEPEYVKTLVGMLDNNLAASAVYCGFQWVDASNRPLPQRSGKVVNPEKFYETLLEANFLVPSCMFVRTSCYRQVGFFDCSLTACEDWDMWLRIASRHTVVGTPEKLVRYRVLPDSMSSDPELMLRNRLAVLNKCFVRGVDAGSADPIENRAFARAHFRAAVEYLQSQREEESFQNLRRAMVIDPSLLLKDDVFYELGCAIQPRGFSGDFSSLDVSRAAETLMRVLGRLFGEGEFNNKSARDRNAAFGVVYFVLGKFCYGKLDLSRARSFLIRALYADWHNLTRLELLITLMKSFAGRRLISNLRRR